MIGVFRFVILLLLVLSLGLHWAVLQTVAWTGMLITYSRDASVRDAISMTFDGKHPCALCKSIKQGRSAEKQKEQQQLKPGSKLDLAVIWQRPGFHFSSDADLLLCLELKASARREQPPKPRPRDSSSSGTVIG